MKLSGAVLKAMPFQTKFNFVIQSKWELLNLFLLNSNQDDFSHSCQLQIHSFMLDSILPLWLKLLCTRHRLLGISKVVHGINNFEQEIYRLKKSIGNKQRWYFCMYVSNIVIMCIGIFQEWICQDLITYYLFKLLQNLIT